MLVVVVDDVGYLTVRFKLIALSQPAAFVRCMVYVPELS